MSEQRMDIFLLAAPQPGVDRSVLVSNLAAAFKKDVPAIEKMLRRPRNLVKADVGPELAAKYKALIEKAGGQCELANRGPAQVVEPAKVQNQVLAIEPVVTPKTQKVETDDSACYCVKCGTIIRIGQNKCPKCFTPVSEFVSKSKTTAGLLALFVGGLGIHRLYLGQWWGIFYLLFWGTLIPSIVSLIEAIVFFATSKESWNRKYGSVPKSSGVVIAVFIAGFFLFIAMTGILAAIAIPAYQDYTYRSKVNNAMPLVLQSKNKVETFIKNNHSYPNDNILVGLSDDVSNEFVESILLQEDAKLVVTYRFLKDRNTIIWTPKETNGDVVWTCTEGTLRDSIRPKECRGGDRTENPAIKVVSAKNHVALTKTIFSEDKHISAQVPESWEKHDLVDGQALGVAQATDETYMVIMRDSKIDFDPQVTVEMYADVIQKQLEHAIKNGTITEAKQAITVGGLPAERFSLQGSVDGMNVAYIITLVEGDKEFYRILTWTLQSRLEKNKELLQKVSDSVTFNN